METIDSIHRSITRRNKLKGFSDLLNYALMPEKNIIMNKDGAIMAFFVYRGKDVQSTTDAGLDYIRAMFNQVFRLTEENWMVEFNLIRIPSRDYPSERPFPDMVSKLIDEERREQYQAENQHFDTLNYLTISRTPSTELSKTVKKFVYEAQEGIKEESLNEFIDKFEVSLSSIIDTFAGVLDIRRIEGEEILKFLHYCISGVNEQIGMPVIPIFLDSYLSNNDFIGGLQPSIGNKHIKVLDFQDFPTHSYPTILDILNTLPIEYRWASRFIPLDSDTARNYMSSHLKHWNQRAKGFMGLMREAIGIENTRFDRDALSMADMTQDAMASNSSGLVRYGFLTKVIVLMSEDKTKLEEDARTIRRQLQQLGYLIRYESVNSVEAYLGSLPGHGYYNLRRPLMDSITLANTAPISSIYQGEQNCPCPYYNSAPSLFYSKTSGSTPYRFNLHVDDVGHTMIIGPTGTGKTTLMGLIMAQHRKYPNSQVFVFDKDNSNKPLILAIDGNYYDIGSDTKFNVNFAPLQYLNYAEEFEWGCTFIEELCELQKIVLNGEKKELIRHTLETLKSSDPKFWKLSDFILSIQDTNIRSALKVYATDGIIGKILNQSSDNVETSTLMGFEFGWLLSQKEDFYIPVINYLFRKLHRSFKRNYPTLLILEEAWLYLDNPIISKKLKDWLKTLRKFNVSVIFTSQALSDVSSSSISAVLAESCVTKIYLANSEALSSSKSTYQYFGLNERQIQLISQMRYKRDYYVTNAYGNRVIDLGLGPLALAFIGISSKQDKEKFYSIYRKENSSWIDEWLDYKGLSQWKNNVQLEEIVR
ncbi:MAG TPA: hypothetical protein DD381_13910 [Lentisphaeria bacterium]|nr:MAG: hypothetical protein A2X47_02465 [Lentisphaerae bacterium GWF2_38_69]HBM17418.1 hypothetical protein [Lentisphaeria bacterium]